MTDMSHSDAAALIVFVSALCHLWSHFFEKEKR
jgi:hypothetical protein